MGFNSILHLVLPQSGVQMYVSETFPRFLFGGFALDFDELKWVCVLANK